MSDRFHARQNAACLPLRIGSAVLGRARRLRIFLTHVW